KIMFIIEKKFFKIFFVLLTSLFLKTTSPKYVIGHWPGGMGICLTSTLNHLLYCDRKNITPVIYWNKSLYHNSNGFNGKKNEWEYYFNPVSNLTYNGETINHFCMDQGLCGSFSYYD